MLKFMCRIRSLLQFTQCVHRVNNYCCSIDLFSHPSQKARDVKGFLMGIGTTLKALEAETQHENQAKLLMGMFKEAMRKDLSESNSPIVLWDYCMER